MTSGMAREPKEPPGKPAVVVAMHDAVRDLARQKRNRADPLPAEERGGAAPGKWTQNNLGLPNEDACPVEPVGIEGELFHLIDSARQFRSLTAGDFSQAGIQALFAQTPHYPMWAWPRYGRRPPPDPETGEQRPPPIKSFEADHVRQCIFRACTRKGLFSPTDKLRGRGGWTLRSGEMIYHAGEEIWRCELQAGTPRFRALDTGLIEGHLYPRTPALPSPWTEPISSRDNPARGLMQMFRSLNWERPEIDPVLLLGWLGVAFLGAALEWRPAIMLLGGFGTGKSTLQDDLKKIFGEALFQSADTTAAGIYQQMAHDARPVAVDELEAEADTRKVDNVIKLMRAAASGGFAARGSSGHEPVQFTLRSAFLFSAINNPIQQAQDLSRVAILRLRELRPDQAHLPLINVDTCGRMLLAQLMTAWPRFEETRTEYMRALAAGGHVARGQKTYGTLLACADMLLGAELAAELNVPLTEDTAWWTDKLAAAKLPEVEDAAPNWRDCLEYLLTAQVEPWRNGARSTVGKLLDDLNAHGSQLSVDDVRRDLGMTGLGYLVKGERALAAVGPLLAIPNKSQLVARLFGGSKWAGSPGGGGPWKDALRQGPRDVVLDDPGINRVRINGAQQRCTLVALEAFERMTKA